MIPDSEYRVIISSVPIATVDLVIFNPDRSKTLVFKRNNKPAQGIFYTLGGRIMKNESPEQALGRICKAEGGIDLDVSNIKFSGYISEVFEDSMYDSINSHCINLYFSYQLDENERVFMDDQHLEYQWVKLSDLKLNSLIHPFAKEKILKAWSGLCDAKEILEEVKRG
jgi:colanic acid biosynthesis protein WcaH